MACSQNKPGCVCPGEELPDPPLPGLPCTPVCDEIFGTTTEAKRFIQLTVTGAADNTQSSGGPDCTPCDNYNGIYLLEYEGECDDGGAYWASEIFNPALDCSSSFPQYEVAAQRWWLQLSPGCFAFLYLTKATGFGPCVVETGSILTSSGTAFQYNTSGSTCLSGYHEGVGASRPCGFPGGYFLIEAA